MMMAPKLVTRVATIIGVRLYSPERGCQPSSVKKRASPTSRSAGADSRNRKIRISNTIAAEVTAKARETILSSRSVRDIRLTCDRNEILRLDQIMHVGRSAEADKRCDK